MDKQQNLKLEALAAVALQGGAFHWGDTPIGHNDGILADATKFLQPEWWKRSEPRDERGEIFALLKRAGLGELRDDVESENRALFRPKGDSEKTGIDEEEPWRAYMGEPKDDAREWLARLAKDLDGHGDGRGFFQTLKDHIGSKPRGARFEDLNQKLVEFCLKQLCSE